MAKLPLLSVVIDGYNESRDLGTAAHTMEALRRQDFPLNQVEVVLIGSAAQLDDWRRAGLDQGPFHAVKMVAADGAHYLELKNRGAQAAAGEIIALTDSDVYPKPTWLTAIVEGIGNGADVVVGPSLFRNRRDWVGDGAVRQAAASITWGWIIGKSRSQFPPPVGFMDHNVACRAEVLRAHQYRTGLGRVLGASLLLRAFTNAGVNVVLNPDQQVVHHFAWKFWLVNLHFRYGYEVYLLRRLDRAYPNQWIARTSVLEPVVTMGWHVLLNIPRWFRFSRLIGLSPARRWALLPVVIMLAVAAHTFEMAGMYGTLLAPKAMKRWAESA